MGQVDFYDVLTQVLDSTYTFEGLGVGTWDFTSYNFTTYSSSSGKSPRVNLTTFSLFPSVDRFSLLKNIELTIGHYLLQK